MLNMKIHIKSLHLFFFLYKLSVCVVLCDSNISYNDVVYSRFDTNEMRVCMYGSKTHSDSESCKRIIILARVI